MVEKGGKKCPRCGARFAATKAGSKAFQKHYASKHYKAKTKKKSKTWKVPGFAKRGR